MGDKFIHHDRITALTCSDDGADGAYDVYEDNGGIYVSNPNEGVLQRCDTLEVAREVARDKADAYDKKRWLRPWQAAVEGGELRGFWDWLRAEHTALP